MRNTHSKASSLAPIYTETYVTMSNSSSIEYFTIPHYHHALSLGNYLCMRMIILNCTGLQVPPELNEKHKKLKNHLAAFRAISFHPEPINDFLNQPILFLLPPFLSLLCMSSPSSPPAAGGGRREEQGRRRRRRKKKRRRRRRAPSLKEIHRKGMVGPSSLPPSNQRPPPPPLLSSPSSSFVPFRTFLLRSRVRLPPCSAPPAANVLLLR